MSSIQHYIHRIKPALDNFLISSNQVNLNVLVSEIKDFEWIEISSRCLQVLIPLLVRLDELNSVNLELQTSLLECITLLISKLYLKDIKGVHMMLVIILKQVREDGSANLKKNLSEEFKLATIKAIDTCFQRSTTDILEYLYTEKYSVLLGQVLLILTEIIEKEQYRKLVIAAMESVMTVFYVNDNAELYDVILRNQVANTLFIYLPKTVTVLFKCILVDEKYGEKYKLTGVKALGRVLHIMYEQTERETLRPDLSSKEFMKLINDCLKNQKKKNNVDSLKFPKKKDEVEKHLKNIQNMGRTKEWFGATSSKLQAIFSKITILRSHDSANLRYCYAQFCCNLMLHCNQNLKDNYIFLLESVLAMTEDDDLRIQKLCKSAINESQVIFKEDDIYEVTCEIIFDDILKRLPRIINRCNEMEQYAELLFLKAFLRNMHANKIHSLISIGRNLEMLTICLIEAIDLEFQDSLMYQDLSFYEYNVLDKSDYDKKEWRKFKKFSSTRCIKLLEDICSILGKCKEVKRIITFYLLELLEQHNRAMNEILMLLIWIVTPSSENSKEDISLIHIFLKEILKDKHWHLSLVPDNECRLKVKKNIDWIYENTPGLYESAIEIRTQNCDSDDDDEDADEIKKMNRVSIQNAQFNVLHTCIILDAIAHCSLHLKDLFMKYMLQCFHKVLLHFSSGNAVVFNAAFFAVRSIQISLNFKNVNDLIESQTDYLTFHLNKTLSKSSDNPTAIKIVSVLLKFATPKILSYLETIFNTIKEESAKPSQWVNLATYLRLYISFVGFVKNLTEEEKGISEVDLLFDDANHVNQKSHDELYLNWIAIIKRKTNNTENIDVMRKDPETELSNSLENPDDSNENNLNKNINDNKDKVDGKDVEAENQENNENVQADEDHKNDIYNDKKKLLPTYIQMVKEICEQCIKFMSSRNESHQIETLECLIISLPILKLHEDEYLPIIHNIWQPLMEKFRENSQIVVYRCFGLLTTMIVLAKDFILKRSLDDIIPHLKKILLTAAVKSASENTSQTQENKLQIKLLRELPTLIINLKLEGRVLDQIVQAVIIYLSKKQPTQFQEQAKEFFKILRMYNGPLVYIALLSKETFLEYKENVTVLLEDFKL